MHKVALVTATRAEYGILKPLILRLQEEKEIELQVLVTGTHLSEKYGNTINEILEDKIPVFAKIPILAEENTAYGVTLTMANAACGFGAYFQRERPELVVVLGDRTELLGICAAALHAQIPIAHLHGGEVTEGAIDDCIRHAVTKMSYLHFVAAEPYRRRVIQLGEDPNRVFLVGGLGVENVLHCPLWSREKIEEEIGIPSGKPYVVGTFHPVTTEPGKEKEQVEALLRSVKQEREFFYIFTMANADVGGAYVNKRLQELEREVDHMKVVSSLGMVRYLSAVKHSVFVLGNSSSGILEAPALGTPTVNIGNREKGRLMADTVISCEADEESITTAMQKAAKMVHRSSFLYGDGHTSERIVAQIKKFLMQKDRTCQKVFYDLEGV